MLPLKAAGRSRRAHSSCGRAPACVLALPGRSSREEVEGGEAAAGSSVLQQPLQGVGQHALQRQAGQRRQAAQVRGAGPVVAVVPVPAWISGWVGGWQALGQPLVEWRERGVPASVQRWLPTCAPQLQVLHPGVAVQHLCRTQQLEALVACRGRDDKAAGAVELPDDESLCLR
jgi:hypothetical protein